MEESIKMISKKLFLMFISFLLLINISVWSEEKKDDLSKTEKKVSRKDVGFGFVRSSAPIDILSDTVEANQKQNIITFKGNVIAKQEDITLYTNTLIVIYDPDTKKIKEVQAIGNVRIIELQRRVTSQKAFFYQDENKIILEGDAVIREDDNVIRGERAIYYLNEERSIIEGGKTGRVSTSIVPSSSERKKK